ncbi:MAG: hypothetical protein ACXAEX_00570 [Promethearchaeota archaeon]|jgi:hypothetical protein
MEKDTLTKFLISLKICITLSALILVILNIDVISVIHARESESLPVLKYETYTSIELSIFYVIILLAVVNIALMLFEKFKRIKPYFVALTPIISILMSIILILNPHSIIINPTGWPPTQIDVLKIGTVFGLVLFVFLAIDSVLVLHREGFTKKYFSILAILIVAFLISDFIHESGHAFFILISGGNISKFYPFPVLMGGEFNAGYVGYANVPPNFEPIVLLGGEIFQWIVLGIVAGILYLRKPKKLLKILLMFLLIIAIMDFPLYTINNTVGLPHWFLIGSTHGDVIMFSTITGFPILILIILAFTQLIIGGILFYYLICR